MRALIQRVKTAKVTVNDQTVAEITHGLVILLGIGRGDTPEQARFLAGKIASLRIFEDQEGKFNRSILDLGGAAIVVSQFTLYGDCRKGRRPSFIDAAEPAEAKKLYEQLVFKLRERGTPVETGEFQAKMEVHLVNDGPVTILLDSRQ